MGKVGATGVLISRSCYEYAWFVSYIMKSIQSIHLYNLYRIYTMIDDDAFQRFSTKNGKGKRGHDYYLKNHKNQNLNFITHLIIRTFLFCQSNTHFIHISLHHYTKDINESEIKKT